MNMKILIAVSAVLLAGSVSADEHAKCPHHSSKHRAAVDSRHDEVTRVSHDASVHHFLLNESGGTIRLEVTDPKDSAGRDRVREHLQVVARSFASGDFALPMLIHDQVPPGVDVMKARKESIAYTFAATDRGGEVRIATKNAVALTAIHAFLRFQIDDHGTGDPKE
jgi:hypothetical protein